MITKDQQTIDGLKDILAHLNKMTERLILDNIASVDRDGLALTTPEE